MKHWIRREIGPQFSRHPNTKRRQRVKANRYDKHTIRASLRRHSLRIAKFRAAALGTVQRGLSNTEK